jgi:hypothetical protein
MELVQCGRSGYSHRRIIMRAATHHTTSKLWIFIFIAVKTWNLGMQGIWKQNHSYNKMSYPRENSPRYPLNGRLGGPQSLSRCSFTPCAEDVLSFETVLWVLLWGKTWFYTVLSSVSAKELQNVQIRTKNLKKNNKNKNQGAERGFRWVPMRRPSVED